MEGFWIWVREFLISWGFTCWSVFESTSQSGLTLPFKPAMPGDRQIFLGYRMISIGLYFGEMLRELIAPPPILPMLFYYTRDLDCAINKLLLVWVLLPLLIPRGLFTVDPCRSFTLNRVVPFSFNVLFGRVFPARKHGFKSQNQY